MPLMSRDTSDGKIWMDWKASRVDWSSSQGLKEREVNIVSEAKHEEICRVVLGSVGSTSSDFEDSTVE
jgi:hypothetical protein